MQEGCTMLSSRLPLSKLSSLELMRRLKDLSHLTPAQLMDVQQRMSASAFRRGDLIFREESVRTRYTYLLLTGTAQWSYVNANISRVVAIVTPGLIIKLPLMPEEIGHCFELKALSECKVGRLLTSDFMSITVGADPELYAKMSDAENGRLGRLMARYQDFTGLGVLSRTVVALMELVSDFGVSDDRGMLLRISPTHQQLADLIGASRSKVTRMLADLELRGIVIRQGRQIIINVPRARAFLGRPVRPRLDSTVPDGEALSA